MKRAMEGMIRPMQQPPVLTRRFAQFPTGALTRPRWLPAMSTSRSPYDRGARRRWSLEPTRLSSFPRALHRLNRQEPRVATYGDRPGGALHGRARGRRWVLRRRLCRPSLAPTMNGVDGARGGGDSRRLGQRPGDKGARRR